MRWIVVACAAGLCLTNLALAQDQPAEKVEEIEVTGSHIKRVDVEGIAPVETITHKDIEKKGYDNLGDVVRDLGANSFGSGTVSGNSTVPGNADIDLRGLGSDNTLVLLNGQRLPQDAITGTVDINLVPIAAVDRIEILKDGASAIYGSDALGGVVNIITRKDFQGTEISATQSLPTDYSDGKMTKIGLVNGINGEKFNVVTSLGYRYDQAINSRNRPWSNNEFSQIGNPGSYANIGAGGVDGPTIASPSCPANLLLTTPAGTVCQFRFSDYSQETPLINQIGGLSELHYEVNSDLRLSARVSYVRRDANTIAAPAPAGQGQIVIPAATASTYNSQSALPGWTGGDLDMSLRMVALGNRVTDVVTNSYGVMAGATIQLPHDWSMDVTPTFSIVTANLVGTSGYALNSAVTSLIASGKFNPFVPTAQQIPNPSDAASLAYQPTQSTTSELAGLEVKASGDVYELSSGNASLAVGGLVNWALYNDTSDAQTLAGNVLGNAGSSGEGHRTSEALYAELAIPVVKKTLELQLAGRFDNYSDFGTTVNPKIGFLLHAGPSVLVRGSVGTGFRAPLLTELYAGQGIGYPSFVDYVACAKNPGSIYCNAQQYQVTSGGNPGLKQETAVSYTLGAIVEPVKDLNFGTDWFYTSVNNMPGIDYNDMTLVSQASGQGQPGTTTLAGTNVQVTRDSSGIIQSVVAPLQNLSSEQVAGVDITAAYSFSRFKISTEQNQMFFYKVEGFPGAGLTNKLGWNGLPSWRNTSAISYNPSNDHDLTFTARSIPHQLQLGSQNAPAGAPIAYVSPITTFDIAYTYKNKTWGDFSVGVINILASAPPQDPTQPTGMVNYSLYDPNGRQVVLGYRKKL
jgi:iron complex outermembrane receptor protein